MLSNEIMDSKGHKRRVLIRVMAVVLEVIFLLLLIADIGFPSIMLSDVTWYALMASVVFNVISIWNNMSRAYLLAALLSNIAGLLVILIVYEALGSPVFWF